MRNKFVPESLNEYGNQKGIRETAGLVIIQDNKILLVHPSNSPWFGTYSIPKGGLDKKENPLDAAIRETREETGIKIKRKHVSQKDGGIIDYTDKLGRVYKRVHYFVVFPKKPITPDMYKLQLKEVDYAAFLNYDEAKKRIYGRFRSFLMFLT